MATVQFEHATVQYPGADRPSVDALNIDIADGEFIVLVGPSGCGKSTSLRALAGLEAVAAGRIMIDDVDVTALSPKRRDVAMVFQNYALYPNMTVAENMGFALRNSGITRADTAVRVNEVAKMLEMEHLLGTKPGKLSGGQRQRVAMGRAIVRHPKVFAMDEPLSNLDARLRVSTRSQISELQRRLGVTTVFVTHDQVEAMTMGDRVVVLRDAQLQQVDSPRKLYDDPVNTFVAGFIGSPGMNLLPGRVTGEDATFGSARVPVPRSVRTALTTDQVTIGIRPEGWALVTPGAPGAVRATAELLEELGPESLLHARLVDGVPAAKPVIVRVDRHTAVSVGQPVDIRPVTDDVFFFDSETGNRLR